MSNFIFNIKAGLRTSVGENIGIFLGPVYPFRPDNNILIFSGGEIHFSKAKNVFVDDIRLHKNVFALAGVMEFIQNAGEIVFVPSGWYHQVHNLVYFMSSTFKTAICDTQKKFGRCSLCGLNRRKNFHSPEVMAFVSSYFPFNLETEYIFTEYFRDIHTDIGTKHRIKNVKSLKIASTVHQ